MSSGGRRPAHADEVAEDSVVPERSDPIPDSRSFGSLTAFMPASDEAIVPGPSILGPPTPPEGEVIELPPLPVPQRYDEAPVSGGG